MTKLTPRVPFRSATRAASVMAAATLLLLACGGDSDGPSPSDATPAAGGMDGGAGAGAGGVIGMPSGPVPEGDFASLYAEALCAEGALANCCRTNGLAYDRSQCTSVGEGLAQLALNKGRSKGLAYDPMRAGACVAAVRAYVRSCGSGATDDDSCDGLFIGNKEPGAACDDSNECRPSAEGEVRCNNWSSMGQSGSLCQVVKPVGLGGACTSKSSTPPPATVSNCQENQDLYCDSQSSSCRSMPKAGEACFISCARSAFCKVGRCVERADVGGACDSDSFFNAQCVDGAYCDVASTKTCRSQKAPGDACVANAECKSRSCANGKCDATSDLTLTLVCSGRL